MTMTDMASAATGQDGAVASGKGPRAGQPKRRTFTAAYKARILCEYDQLESGRERGALLRREGLYSSHIDGWRKGVRLFKRCVISGCFGHAARLRCSTLASS